MASASKIAHWQSWHDSIGARTLAAQRTEVLEHGGYRIRLTHAGLEWIAAVALPKQRPTLIMAPDREATIAKAHEWIELQLRSGKSLP